MTTTRHRRLVSFTDDELARVQAHADQLRLSFSELLRRLALGHRVPQPGDFMAAREIADLLKVNADLARLGNLLKLAIDEADQDFPPAMVARIEHLVAEIRDTQQTLGDSVKAVHRVLHPRRTAS